MHARTLGLVPVSLALALAATGCGKKEPADQAAPKAGRGAGAAAEPASGAPGAVDGTGNPIAEAPRPPPPPAKALPPLAADPGGANGDVTAVTTLGGPKTDTIRALAAGSDGSAYAAGYFEAEASFGATTRTAAGKSDAFVARFAPDGKLVWATPIGGTGDDVADAVAVGTDGTIAVGGLFSDQITAGTLAAKAYGSDDVFVAGVDPSGELQWIWTAGGIASDATTALVASPDGGFVAAVSYAGKATFGPTALESRGGDDAALIKLSAVGAVEWVTPIGGEGADQIKRLAIDGNGNLFVLAVFRDRIDLGAGPLVAAGGNDLLLARFDASGRHVWSHRLGNPFNEMAGGIAVDRAGNLVITGSYDKDLDFLGTKLMAAGESDIFVARVSPDGALLWVKSFGGPREDVGYGIGVDDAGNPILTGWFESPLDFGAGVLTGKGQKDGFIAKLTVDGKPLWSRRFGDWDHDSGNAIAVCPDGTTWLAGIFRYQLDLQTAVLSAAKADGARLAYPDAFVARFAR